MAPLNWATYLERAVGKGHPTLSDTVNRALRQLLTESGYDPDSSPFPGLASRSKILNAAVFPKGTSGVLADDYAVAVNAAVAAAPGLGKTIVEVPASWVPYNGNNVAFNAAVLMIVEAGDPTAYELAAYGLIGDGTTNESVLLQTVLNLLPAYGRLRAQPGKTYLVSRTHLPGADPSKFITPFVPATATGVTLDLRGATIKVQGAAFDVGGGGGGLGVLNIVADDVAIRGGTLDCASIAAYGVAAKMWDGTNGRGLQLEHVTIANTNESLGHSWTGIVLSLGTDVPGTSITATYHKEVGGSIKRPGCPILDPSTDTITAHDDVTGLIVGGPTTDTGSSFGVLTRSTAQWNLNWQKPDPKGIWLYPQANDKNNHLLDLILHDLGCCQIELYGPLMPQPQRPTWGASVTIDVNKGMVHFVTATSDIAATIAAPSNLPNASDRAIPLRIVFFNNSGTNLTTPIVFASGAGAYKAVSGVVPPSGGRVVVDFVYDKINNLWQETSRSTYVLFQRSGLNTTSTSDASVTSFPLPAGTLSLNGQAIRIIARGREVTQNGQVNIKFGATQLFSASPTAGSSWEADICVTRTGATSQLSNGHHGFGGNYASNAAQPAETLANAITIDFRGSVTAGGTLNYDYVMIEIVSAGV